MKNTKYFMRLLVSFLIVFLIPVIFICTTAYDSVFKRTEERLIDETYQNFKSSVSNLNTRLSDIQQLATQLSSDPLYYPHNLNLNAYHVMLAMRQLSNYTSTNKLLENTMFFYKRANLLFSSGTSYNTLTFASRSKSLEHLNDEDFQEIILNTRGMEFSGPVSSQYPDGNESVLFMTQIPLSSVNPYGTLITPIAQKDMRDSVLIPEEANPVLLVLDQASEIVWNVLATENELVASVIKNHEGFPKTVRIDGVRYYLMSAELSFKNLSIVGAIKLDSLLAEAGSEKLNLIMLLLATVAVGFVIIYYLSRINYDPIRKINDLLQNVLRSNSTLALQNERSQNAYKHGLVMNMLLGKFNNHGEFDVQGALFEFTLPFNSFRVIAVSTQGESKVTEDWLIEKTVVLNAYGVFYAIKVSDEITVILIDGSLSVEETASATEKIIGLFKQHIETVYSAGISEPFSDLSKAPESYIQAITALDLSVILNSSHIYFYDEAQVHEEDNNDLVAAYLKQIQKQLILREHGAFLETVDSVCAYITSTPNSVFTIRLHLLTVLNTIISYARKLPLRTPLDLRRFDFLGVSIILSTEELVRMIHDLSNEISGKLLKEDGNEGNAVLEDMIKYLDENALRADFSIKSMAGVFKMTDSSLSRYYKKQTGQNISDIITKSRIVKAQDLLLNTDLSLKDITQRVGYYDVSSFSKKFKMKTGISPSEFRLKRQQSSSEFSFKINGTGVNL